MQDQMKQCPSFRQLVPLETQYCSYCGNCFLKKDGSGEIPIPPKHLAGYLLTDLEAVIGKNSDIYIEKFRKRRHGELTFNWCAALFGKYWFGYRQMWKLVFILFDIPKWIINQLIVKILIVLAP